MSAPAARDRRFNSKDLLRILAFLRNRWPRVTLSLALLLMILAADLALPQFIGDAITDLRRAVAEPSGFSADLYVRIILSLVLIRTGLAYVLGPIRNRTVQGTLADIRAAIYNAVQRLPFAYHDKASSGELISRSTSDVF